jgi:hypothetical protein
MNMMSTSHILKLGEANASIASTAEMMLTWNGCRTISR